MADSWIDRFSVTNGSWIEFRDAFLQLYFRHSGNLYITPEIQFLLSAAEYARSSTPLMEGLRALQTWTWEE